MCAKLTEAATQATRAVEMQGRQITALMSCVAGLSREMEERCGVDRAELVETALTAMRAEMGSDPERDSVLRSLLGQTRQAPAEKGAPGPALRLIPGGKV
ncbi:hypothetical protein [Methylobacterium radiodurans]|uniref:hypothetical protein n=1 Tax=Methylobacterium radiodurans TaxID=2202828 RepID=UPI0013A5A2D2|nr:hypothetical protein [Methylobacterium radiodurans]